LKAAKSMLDEWLGVITAHFEYPRGYDTRRLAEDVAAKFLRRYKEFDGTLPPLDEIPLSTYRI
jgi:hypothetical protein